MSLMDWLFGNSSSGGGAQAQPNLPTNVDVGSADPQVPTYGDFRNGYGTSSVLQGMHDGYLSGLAKLFGPDTSGQAYNAMLREAQQTKEGQYDVNYFGRNQPGAGGGPMAAKVPGAGLIQTMQTPGAPPVPGAPVAAPAASAAPAIDDASDPRNAALKTAFPDAFAPAPAQAQPSPGPAMLTGAAPQASGGMTPGSIMQRLQGAMSSPKAMASAPALISLYESLLKGGYQMGPNGMEPIPGAATTQLSTAASGAGVPLNGVDLGNNDAVNSAYLQHELAQHTGVALGTGLLMVDPNTGQIINRPGVVPAASGKAGAIKGSEADATNRSNRTWLPETEGQIADRKMLADKGLYRDANGVIQNQPGATTSLGKIEDAKPWSLRPGGFTEFDSQGNLRGQTSATQTGVDANGAPTSRFGFPPINLGQNFLGGAGFPAGSGAMTSTPGGASGQQGTEPWTTGLPPAQKSFLDGRGTSLAKDFEGYGNAATAANQTQFTIDQMRNEAGPQAGWTPGHFADWSKDFRSILNGAGISGPDQDAALANQQAFEKNSMQLTTQATKAVSPRAAAQEMLLIRDAMPQSKTSPGGLNYIFDQFTANNDFTKAKATAAENYLKTSPDKTSAGFEAQWNSNISPFAFLAHRMSNDQFTTLATNLAKTAQGRGLVQRIVGEMQYADKNGLFQGGQ